MQLCERDEGCLSVSHSTSDQICELFSATRYTAGYSTSTASGYRTYEKIVAGMHKNQIDGTYSYTRVLVRFEPLIRLKKCNKTK